ncbi:MAG: hypothetical protein WEA31_09875, partial [Pirellulales bacterium]
EMIELGYEANSFAGVATAEHLKRLEDRLALAFGRRIRLPKDYCDHLLRFHGGVPIKRCFKLPSGKTRTICRFCNWFTDEDIEPPLEPTWRQWAAHDIRMDYSIHSFFEYENWRVRFDHVEEAEELVPIAVLDWPGLDSREMDTFDLLCFNFKVSTHPPILVWEFENFHRFNSDTTFVASSFTGFTEMLFTDASNPVMQQTVSHF